jgi:hypothetical protein
MPYHIGVGSLSIIGISGAVFTGRLQKGTVVVVVVVVFLHRVLSIVMDFVASRSDSDCIKSRRG